MARPWRIQFEGAVYHITSRGNANQAIFLDDRDRSKFLDLLGRGRERFAFVIYSFCLMDNHFHIFLRTPLANLSQGMHWLNGTYTGYFNHRHQRIGHLFQGRFKSVLVIDDAHYLHLSMYIHLNPVRAGIVENPAQYPWSSFKDYVGLRPGFKWLDPEDILSHYGKSPARRKNNYRKECLELIGMKPKFVEQLKTSAIIGPAERVKEMVNKYKPGGKIKAVSDYSAEKRRGLSVAQELRRVAEAFQVKPEKLLQQHRNFPARQAAYYHLVENCGVSVVKTAETLGVSLAGVSLGIRRLKERLPKDKTLKLRVGQLSKM